MVCGLDHSGSQPFNYYMYLNTAFCFVKLYHTSRENGGRASDGEEGER